MIVPDLAGWKVERLPTIPDRPWLDLAPDWGCEVPSSSTAGIDRGVKREILAREAVPQLRWLGPLARALEVLRLGPQGEDVLEAGHVGAAVVRGGPPFGAVELDLMLRWGWKRSASRPLIPGDALPESRGASTERLHLR